jgi:hypothetical protein
MLKYDVVVLKYDDSALSQRERDVNGHSGARDFYMVALHAIQHSGESFAHNVGDFFKQISTM